MGVRNSFVLYVFSIVVCISLVSCGGKREEPAPVTEDVERVTVVYAVNKSSLSDDFTDDSEEMLRAMTGVDASKQRLLLYRTDSTTQTGLYEATHVNGVWVWKKVALYDRDEMATDPARLQKVIRDVCEYYPDALRTLIFWGHGSSWYPEFSGHYNGGDSTGQSKPQKSYGGEYTPGGTQWMELDELAAAVPEGAFDVIWFDCCYMSSIEVAYQLRDKADWLVGYPTEVWDSGLNYDCILPNLMKKTPALVEAARDFYDYYDKTNDPVTVAVMDLRKIEPVADAMKAIFSTYPAAPSVNDVTNYRRFSRTGFYDMRQLAAKRSGNDARLMNELDKAMGEFVVFQSCSSRDFNNRLWIDGKLCGVSIHNFSDAGTDIAEYYKKLDWYRRTAPTD